MIVIIKDIAKLNLLEMLMECEILDETNCNRVSLSNR